MKIVGITGGIGSGKSTVASIFQSLGYAIYEADSRAKYLMNHDQGLIQQIKSNFGEAAYSDEGLNRPYLAGIVFNNSDKLNILNSIVHPATGKDYLNWKAEISKTNQKAFAFKEAAILYESGAYLGVDAVLAVYASKNTRIDRTQKRDGATADEIKARMNKQWPERKKCIRANYVIYNDGIHPLSHQIRTAIQFFGNHFQ